MIFDAKYARQIASGKATVLRVPAHKGKAGARYAPIAWKVAHDYPICTRAGKDPLCHVRVVGIERERFVPTLAQARGAGFKTTDDLKQWWIVRHEQAWLRAERFDLMPEVPSPELADIAHVALIDRFDRCWQGAEVWVITIRLSSDVPRYLAQQRGRARGDGQYVPSPSQAIDDAECIEPARLERYARTAEAFCLERQVTRADEAKQQRTRTKALKHPAPWWDEA
jgi:hypothetical protein